MYKKKSMVRLMSLGSLEVIGIAILVGFMMSVPFNRLKIPAVAGHVLIGVVMGGSVLNLFTIEVLDQVGVINDIVLGIIAFIIGGELRFSQLIKLGRAVLFIVIGEAFGAFLLVFIALQLFFHNLALSLILAAISAATAPAATLMVIQEMRARGNFTRMLIALVAIDDGIALLIYSIASAFSKALISGTGSMLFASIVVSAGKEIFLSIGIGILAGSLVAPVVRKFSNRDSIFVVIVGTMFMITGFAKHLYISQLLTNMAFGVIVTNYCRFSSNKVFDMLKKFSTPIFIAFFVTAGAHLRFDLIPSIWLMGLIYTVCRIAGKLLGSSGGAILANAPTNVRKYIGFGLLSQIGVAVGLALVVTREFYQLGPQGVEIANIVINLLLTTTIITEIIGPILTRYALLKTGDAIAR